MASERLTIALICSECKNKNYYQVRGKKKEYKLELNKFWRRLTGKPPVSKTGTEGSSPSAPARFYTKENGYL